MALGQMGGKSRSDTPKIAQRSRDQISIATLSANYIERVE